MLIQAEFERELEDAGDRLIAVDFTADWCTKTDDVTKRLNDVMSLPEFSEVIFLRVDVDDNEVTVHQSNATICQRDLFKII